MMDDRDRGVWAIIIVFGIIIGYFSLSWAWVVPEQYNVIEQYFGTDAPEDNSTVISENADSLTSVTGIPSIVNITEYSYNYDLPISFRALEGTCDNFVLYIDASRTTTNATIELVDKTPINQRWIIQEDVGANGKIVGYRAIYDGIGLLPVEDITINLVITGNAYTTSGIVTVMCTSNGDIQANEGAIYITA
jgi:hypothetical protein